MFELIIKCSRNVRKITIDFDDKSESIVEMSSENDFQHDIPAKESKISNSPQKDMSDILAERTSPPAPKSKPIMRESFKEDSIPKIDITNRPPAVDEDFQKGY